VKSGIILVVFPSVRREFHCTRLRGREDDREDKNSSLPRLRFSSSGRQATQESPRLLSAASARGPIASRPIPSWRRSENPEDRADKQQNSASPDRGWLSYCRVKCLALLESAFIRDICWKIPMTWLRRLAPVEGMWLIPHRFLFCLK